MNPMQEQQPIEEEEARRRAAALSQQQALPPVPTDQTLQELGQTLQELGKSVLGSADSTAELLGAGLDLLLVATDATVSVLGVIGEAAQNLDAGGFQ
jgi:hypothetical protein